MTAIRSSTTPFTLGYGRPLDALLGLRALQLQYEALPAGPADDFVERALDRLDIRAEVRHADRVPREGGAIVVVNHPTGAMDGLVLLSALRRVRTDVRVLGNQWLTRIPEMREWTIPLDVYTALPSQRLAALRQARRWVDDGGVLVLFPAGAVARRVENGRPADGPWSEGILALARWTGAPTVPVHLDARQSRWLRAAGRLPTWMTTALLPRELLWQRGSRVPVTIGVPVEAERLDELPDAATRLAYLRARVTALAPRPLRPSPEASPIAPQVLPSLVAREVAALAPSDCLGSSGPLQVFAVEAGRIPLTLREIGRLREQTFREVGEGTGGVADLDAFDASYLHLFLWHRTRQQVVGAYRLREVGPGGGRLYTETLFTWGERPHSVLGDALELGRSFVRAEYQRDPAALLLLWKGIGAYVAKRPHLRRLFGPVSVSADYGSVSRDLMARWLRRSVPGHGRVDARHAVEHHGVVTTLLDGGAMTSLADLDRLVRELEEGRGLPVLLRQYLRLNGRVLAISRDPHFGDAMDALLVVDLLDMPPAHLERYCGRQGADRIRRFWMGEPVEGRVSSVC